MSWNEGCDNHLCCSFGDFLYVMLAEEVASASSASFAVFHDVPMAGFKRVE